MTKYSGRIVMFLNHDLKPVYFGKTTIGMKEYLENMKNQAYYSFKKGEKISKIEKDLLEGNIKKIVRYLKVIGKKKHVSIIQDLLMKETGTYEHGCNKKRATRSGKVY